MAAEIGKCGQGQLRTSMLTVSRVATFSDVCAPIAQARMCRPLPVNSLVSVQMRVRLCRCAPWPLPLKRAAVADREIYLFLPAPSPPFSPCSDPDIKIGLSILAYRYEGLRRSDFESVLRDLHEEMAQELIPFNRRQACIRFAQWVALAGGRVRGWTRVEEEERQRKKEKREQAERLLREAEQELAAAALGPRPTPITAAASSPSAADIFFPSPSNGGDLDLLSSPNFSGTSSSGAGSSASVVGSMTPTRSSALAAGVSPGGPAGEIDGANRSEEVWPLQLIDTGDEEQMDVLYNLLHKLPHISYHYLMGSIFPPVMRHQRLKLSASGQSLGGDMLFKKRLAFSGTPSDLLPLELGKVSGAGGRTGGRADACAARCADHALSFQPRFFCAHKSCCCVLFLSICFFPIHLFSPRGCSVNTRRARTARCCTICRRARSCRRRSWSRTGACDRCSTAWRVHRRRCTRSSTRERW